jgi:hypothetical protein
VAERHPSIARRRPGFEQWELSSCVALSLQKGEHSDGHCDRRVRFGRTARWKIRITVIDRSLYPLAQLPVFVAAVYNAHQCR